MIATLKSYDDIIDTYTVTRYRQVGNAYEFVAIAYLKDNSSLHIRDYVFLDGSRKYSFHWQDEKNMLIRRWDNAEHHKHLATFPFHVHTKTGVENSAPMNLAKVLEFIQSELAEK